VSRKLTIWKTKLKALSVERNRWLRAYNAAERKLFRLNDKMKQLESKIEHELATTK
jgi:hypothetical protein